MHRSRFFWISALGLILPFASVPAQEDSISAITGLQQISQRYGLSPEERIVEMRGAEGQPQPEEWWIVVYSPSSAFNLHTYWTDRTRVADEGANEEFYPDIVPRGFIDRQKLQVDSTAAFRTLDAEARRAGVGFDSINYRLRCREGSDEPVWEVTAIDGEGYKVGRVHLSGATGEVYRTIWYFWRPRYSGPPRIVDSALGERYPGATPPPNSPGTTPGIPQALPYDPRNKQTSVWDRPAEAPFGAPKVEVEAVEPVAPLPPASVPQPDLEPTFRQMAPGTSPSVTGPPATPGADLPPATTAVPPSITVEPVGPPSTPSAQPPSDMPLPPQVPKDLQRPSTSKKNELPGTVLNGRIVNDPEGDPVQVIPLKTQPAGD